MNAPSHNYEAALKAERAGEAAAAVELYREVLQAEPRHTAALLKLAHLLSAAGEFEGARHYLEARLALMPGDAETYFHLGGVFLEHGEFAAAANCLEQAAALAPAVPEVHNNLGTALLRLGRGEEAISAIEQALALKPDFAVAFNTLGNAYAFVGAADRAVDAYRRAHDLDPDLAGATVNLGHALRERGRLGDAMDCFTAALERDPRSIAARNGIGVVLQARHRHADAIAAFRGALALEPGNLAVLNNLAISLSADERPALYRDVLAANPRLAEAHANMGHALQAVGRQGEAAEAFRTALELKPEARDLDFYLIHAMMHECDWDGLDGLLARALSQAEAALESGETVSASPFALQATPASPALRLAAAKRTADAVGEGVAAEAAVLRFLHQRPVGPRLRVGYVSPDFRTHSVGLAFAELLGAHDRELFEWYGYSLSPIADDEVSAHYARTFDVLADISALSPGEAARRVNGDGVQVLIDLAGHTKGGRLELFFFEPAPVQAHYLGYGQTLGAASIPYLITDPVHTPPHLAPYCSEALVYLPDSFMAAPHAAPGAEPPPRADCGLPEDGVVFASFNAAYKIDLAMFEVWMRLMTRVQGSVLWLRRGPEQAAANLRREAEARGVAAERLVFAARAPNAVHLARHRHVDIALDTLFHNGGVTSADALASGVPLVSLAGEAPSARIGASLLGAVGLHELIATSLEDYERVALELALDADKRARVKAKLADALGHASLFDMPRLARHLESAYQSMWKRFADGAPPAPIRVPPIAVD